VQLTAMIKDIYIKHINGDFDASKLLKQLDNVQKPFSADHWGFSSPAVTSLSCGCRRHLEEMLCSDTTHSYRVHSPCTAGPPTANGTAPATNSWAIPATGAICLPTAKSDFQLFKADGSCAHLHLNKENPRFHFSFLYIHLILCQIHF